MPDITMCVNHECPVKDTCYRQKATPTPGYQSFAMYPYDADTGCKAYWHIKSKSQVARLNAQTKD